MKQVVTKRGLALIAAAAVAVIGACSDSGKTDQGLTGPNASVINGSSGDTSQTGGRHDSTAKKPVAKFTLFAHVGTPRPHTGDTLTTDPVAGATVSVIEETYTFIRGAGGNDTVNITNTVVATATSDATGNVTFTDLKGASTYLIEAKPPVGSSLQLARIGIGQTFVDPLKLNLTLFHQ